MMREWHPCTPRSVQPAHEHDKHKDRAHRHVYMMLGCLYCRTCNCMKDSPEQLNILHQLSLR